MRQTDVQQKWGPHCLAEHGLLGSSAGIAMGFKS